MLSRGSFDVLVGMDQLSKRKFVIVCHEKVVRIPLKGDEILRVHGERTQGVVKTLLNTKKGRVKLRRVRAMSMTIQSSVKDKILATSSETSKVENAPAEMLRDLDQQMEKREDNGKANVVTDALIRKERVKPRRVRAMAMTIQYGVRGMILTAQSEALKQENVPLVGSEMDEAHASRLRWMIYLVVLADAVESVRDTIGFEYCLASSSGWTNLIGLQLVQEMTDKVVVIKEKLQAKKDHQKSYADNRRKPLEFENCLADASLHVPLDEIKVDKTLRFVEEPVEIMDHEVKSLKRSMILLVKVRWNSKRNPEFTWERKDYMKSKYPQLFVDRDDESAS
ncbi:hypothetical protein Tco_0180797 [Tanacetum coccineum]